MNIDTVYKRRNWLFVLFALVMASIFITARILQDPTQFTISYNPYAGLSLLSVAVNIAVLIALGRLKSKPQELVWFSLFIASVTLFAASEAMQRLSLLPQGAIFWAQISGVGTALLGVGLYLFASTYTRPANERPSVAIPYLIVAAAVIGFSYGNSGIVFHGDLAGVHPYPWGWNNDAADLFPVALAWIEILNIAGLVILIRFYRSISDKFIKRQSLVYIISIMIPLVGGSITDGLLPALGFNSFPPLAVVLETATGLLIFYGMRRFQLFQLNPALLAENILKTMTEAVVVARDDFRIEYINVEAEHLLGNSQASARTKHLADLFEEHSWDIVRRHMQHGDGGTIEHDQIYVVDAARRRIPVRIFTSKLHENDDYTAHVFVISDITDITNSYAKLKLDAEKIRHQNETLEENRARMTKLLTESHQLQEQLAYEKANVEHTVDVRTKELRQAQDQLRAADALKTEFIMLSSHNLRTPITVINGYLEMMKAAKASPEQSKYIAQIESSSRQLGAFVEDLLAITTLEAGDQLVLKPITVGDLMAPLIDEAKALTKSSDVKLVENIHDEGTLINANSLRLSGALRNVVHNATKFTKAGTITVATRTEYGHLLIEVSDTGIGISPGELGNLFTKFHRSTSTLQYDYEGEGIGLYLTKLVVEEHHGSIQATSTLGKGTTFTVTLPVLKSHHLPAGKLHAPAIKR